MTDHNETRQLREKGYEKAKQWYAEGKSPAFIVTELRKMQLDDITIEGILGLIVPQKKKKSRKDILRFSLYIILLLLLLAFIIAAVYYTFNE